MDPNMAAHEEHMRYRWKQYKGTREAILANEGSVEAFAESYKKCGAAGPRIGWDACMGRRLRSRRAWQQPRGRVSAAGRAAHDAA